MWSCLLDSVGWRSGLQHDLQCCQGQSPSEHSSFCREICWHNGAVKCITTIHYNHTLLPYMCLLRIGNLHMSTLMYIHNIYNICILSHYTVMLLKQPRTIQMNFIISSNKLCFANIYELQAVCAHVHAQCPRVFVCMCIWVCTHHSCGIICVN